MPTGSPDTRQTLVSRSELIELSRRARLHHAPSSFRHAVAHRTLGDIRSIYRGQGMDYDESRPYFTGDELRFMNWRVTARTGVAHIKVFREERHPGLVLVIDRRAGMCFGTRTRLKAAQAVRVAAWLAFAARKSNMPVEALVLGRRLDHIRGGTSEADVQRVIAAANSGCKPASHASETSLSLHKALQQLPGLLTRGSRVVLISDLHDLDSTCRSPLVRVSADSPVEVIHIVDPAEMVLPNAGRLHMHAETTTASIDTTDRDACKRYERSADRHRTTSHQILKETAIPYSTVMTNEDSLDALVR